MPYIIYFPYNENKIPQQLTTTNTFIEQAWQELTMLRYLKVKHISSPKLIAPWIDQAETYYLDSIHSNWRSAGLLYYYSFLNLAKALLVAKRRFKYKALDTSVIHHGLSASLQDISSLKDYEIQIFPPSMRGNKNVFSNFYEIVTNCKWDYQNPVTIKLQDILGYCPDVSVESKQLFNIGKRIFPIQSLHREVNQNMWFEMIVPKAYTNVIQTELSSLNLQFIESDKLDAFDRNDWLDAFQLTFHSLKNFTFVRTQPTQFTQDNRTEIVKASWKKVSKNLSPYITAPVYLDVSKPTWDFVQKADIAGKCISWHPVLSNYLMSFALATILRYQPQLLKTGTDNCFYAKAWSSQCSRTTLGYFLMLFTYPPITLGTR